MVDNSELRTILARNIIRLRNDRGLTQTQLANAVGVNRSYVAKLEAAGSSPSAEVLYALADVLGVTADMLRQVPVKQTA